MNYKQKAIQLIWQLLKFSLGKATAFNFIKSWLRFVPPKYAFPLTWMTLSEFPVNSQLEFEYTYGIPRQFPDKKVKVNPNCLHARFFVVSGYYEEYLTKEILSPERKGLLIDIGANFGYYPFLWLQKENTRAIAVEPVQEYVELLHENLKSYESRYAVFDGCIGDRDGVAFLDTLGDPTMLSKVVTDPANNPDTRSVPMLTLSSLIKKYNEEKIDVLKIDAEGYDINILESCKPLFEAKAIKTVFWETANSPEEENIMEFLERLGYSKILDKGATGYELVSG
ncbi:FkbM family methyltransferase [Argonema galeatum]|uniref:FkbM family methyltransferase n=1 Tax=Argonema galeatum TaxID=2942762 RepID=UPI0020123785|nr:FkbM family methyltransferase [Argonema galeatum]MCL1463532.1 FkbM family methyltransferase [Argonema galeatum A003/A1]